MSLRPELGRAALLADRRGSTTAGRLRADWPQAGPDIPQTVADMCRGRRPPALASEGVKWRPLLTQRSTHTESRCSQMILLERFQGSEGARYLLEAIASQTLVQGDLGVARELSEASEIIGRQPGDVIIQQRQADNDLYLILAGSVSIVVNGSEIARRSPRQSIGEMAITDPTSLRSATVIAREETVLARIPETKFSDVASRHPELWRRIAADLATRLRERNELVRQRNEIARVFVGSSTESLAVANAIQAGLAHDPLMVTVWTNDVFGPSEFPIEALERQATETDFAVLVVGPEDRVTSRDQESWAPRDNIVLELGLFVGALGRHRVFLVMPRGVDIKIPTDLLGVMPLRYQHASGRDLGPNMGHVCTQLRDVMGERGVR